MSYADPHRFHFHRSKGRDVRQIEDSHFIAVLEHDLAVGNPAPSYEKDAVLVYIVELREHPKGIGLRVVWRLHVRLQPLNDCTSDLTGSEEMPLDPLAVARLVRSHDWELSPCRYGRVAIQGGKLKDNVVESASEIVDGVTDLEAADFRRVS